MTLDIVNQCKARIEANTHDVRDQVLVAVWTSLVEAIEVANNLRKALDESTLDARTASFHSDIAASRLAKLEGQGFNVPLLK